MYPLFVVVVLCYSAWLLVGRVCCLLFAFSCLSSVAAGCACWLCVVRCVCVVCDVVLSCCWLVVVYCACLFEVC